jgi:hypothetical protein
MIALACALAATAMPALAQREAPRDNDDPGYRDAYRRGFDEGYAQGYRKGLDEGRPVIAPPPPPPPPPPRHTIVVNRATYGAGGRRCDASRAVANIANGQVSVYVEASNDLCGDPAREVRKRLEVDYQCGRVGKRAFANERDSVYLDCR